MASPTVIRAWVNAGMHFGGKIDEFPAPHYGGMVEVYCLAERDIVGVHYTFNGDRQAHGIAVHLKRNPKLAEIIEKILDEHPDPTFKVPLEDAVAVSQPRRIPLGRKRPNPTTPERSTEPTSRGDDAHSGDEGSAARIRIPIRRRPTTSS